MSSLAKDDQIRLIFEDQLDRREIMLPILPEAAANVISLSTSEDADSLQLTNLIQGDMSLAGHVMKVANSAVYRPVTPFVSLQQAITRLGIINIGEIALATSLNTELFEAPGYEKTLRELWHSSLTCSAWAKEIARMRRNNVEESFLSGLLCRMGKPIVIQALADFGLAQDRLMPLVDQYYVRAGALLAAMWELPASVGEVIIHHGHDDSDCSNQELLLNVQAAIAVTEFGAKNLSESMLAKLNFYPTDVERLVEREDAVKQWVETLGG